MFFLKEKLFLGTKREAFEKILSVYKKKVFVVVNFLYFASLGKYVFSEKNKKYIKSLLNSDLVLPDGIALKIYLKLKHKLNIKENLNGTDFTPYFLKNLKGKIHIAFYTVYDEKIGKSKEDADKVETYIKENFNPETIFKFVSHYKDRGKDFDFDKYRQSLSKGQYDFKIFLVGLGTPFQEIWTEENRQFFKDNEIIVMNVGGLFDFWAGFEKRAPLFFRKLKAEWFWRLLQNPKKNLKKVLESIKLLYWLVKNPRLDR